MNKYQIGGELTGEKSLALSSELWTWLAETGAKDKSLWPGWDIYGHNQHHCFTCEYARQQRNLLSTGTGKSRCDFCLSYQLFGDCKKGKALGKWEKARTIKTKKRYATEVLHTITLIKEAMAMK